MNELRAAWRALKASVEDLAEQRQHYLELFEHAEAHLVTDATGIIQEANGKARGLLQRPCLDLHGKPLAALVPLAARARFRTALGGVGAGGKTPEWRSLLSCGEAVIAVDIAVRRAESGVLCWRLRPVA
ncbi:MAG TPA: PAS domain-containing protein [Burkholderiales bacterium]|jgi:nitrogen fixation/metabolism regulation signal transduction histidine kinase|nr:PAS domain-containing protein [Burkholderiales bacterium]